MPKLLVDVDTFTAAVTVPVDGDKRNAASLDVGFQALANRTRKHELDIASIAPARDGVVRIREVADKAALKALFPVSAGDWCYVVGLGLYRFKAGAPAPDLEPMSIASESQGGNWVNAVVGMMGVPGGLQFYGDGTYGLLKTDAACSTVFGGSVGFGKPIMKGGTAYTSERVLEISSDGDKTISANDADVVISYGSMAVDRVYTVANAEPNAKVQLRIVHPLQAGKLVVVRASDGAVLANALDHQISNQETPYRWSIVIQNTSNGWIRIG